MLALSFPHPLATVQGVPINLLEDGSEDFTADADIDSDGSGGPVWIDPQGRQWKDKYFQPRTSLLYKGASLNAQKVPFVVLPPACIAEVAAIVMGCKAIITNQRNGLSCVCVVGDIGPAKKIGEISIAAALRIGVNPNPVNGGEDDHVIRYQVFPGVPAVVDGVTYKLQRTYGA